MAEIGREDINLFKVQGRFTISIVYEPYIYNLTEAIRAEHGIEFSSIISSYLNLSFGISYCSHLLGLVHKEKS